MTSGSDVTAILESGNWRSWQASLSDPLRRAQEARAWCISSHWKFHTPPLEDWKAIVEDLRGVGLPESAVTEMAQASDRGLPFPAIPLFEDEQIGDFCGLLSEPEAAIVVAEGIEAHDGWLSVDPAGIAARCWQSLTTQGQGGLGFGAWQWMLDHAASRRAPLPSPEQAATLVGSAGRLRSKAAVALREAVQEQIESDAGVDEALRVADAMSLWHDARFVEWAVALFAAAGRPTALRQRLEAALAGGTTVGDPAIVERLQELGLTLPSSGRYGEIAAALFDAPPEREDWSAIESEVRQRAADSAGLHPLAEMAAHLRDSDLDVDDEDRAWKHLQMVLQAFPALLEVDEARPERPLPALELAATIRSATTIGTVALGLVEIAGEYRSQPRWWRALSAGLHPTPRRGGFGHANDRFDVAVRVLRLQANWLLDAETKALQAGFIEKGHL